MRCPTTCRTSRTSAGTSRRSAPTGRRGSPRNTSTCARSRSTAVRTKSRRTSSRKRYLVFENWDFESCRFEGLGSRMDFELSEEQRLLKDSVERLLADRYDFSARQRFMHEPAGFSRELWRQYAELGLLGLPFAEDDGGIGGGPVETMIVMEAFGRALALEPYFATVVLPGRFLRLGGSAAAGRERGDASVVDSADRQRRPIARICPRRTPIALRPRRRGNDRAQGRIELHRRWRQDAGDPWRLRG